ncbi:MAG: tetratricopeptide repeat protein [Candidatus Auribacterota bacterium]|jgi:tetratricopeptide (TPR) repeat protein|nr:tetratricopeptide repeat protein [Candidatus Auribacterota bacterium]
MVKCILIAVMIFSFCVSLYASNPEDFFNRAYVYVQRGYADEAIAEYTEALKNNPDSEMATRIYYNMGLIYNNTNRSELAIEMFRKTLQISPELFVVRYNLANTLYDMKLYNEAVAEYEHALVIDPDYSKKLTLYYRIAEACSIMGNHDKSIEWAEKIIAVKPSEAAVWQLLAENYFAKKYYKEVEQCLNKLENMGYPQKDFFQRLQEAQKTENSN